MSALDLEADLLFCSGPWFPTRSASKYPRIGSMYSCCLVEGCSGGALASQAERATKNRVRDTPVCAYVTPHAGTFRP